MLAAAGSTRMPVSRLPHRITSAGGSLKVRRRGRSVALDRGRRSAVWELIEAHLDHNRIDGTVCFATAPAVAAACPTPIADHRFASSPHPSSTHLAGPPHSPSLHPSTAVDSITPTRFVTRTRLP